MNHNGIEHPLDLTGTDNGSWVINKHTYSFLDMLTNLGHTQRIDGIIAKES